MMAMQHQFGAVLTQHIAERSGIGQAAKAIGALDRRMMDQDDAEDLLALEVGEQFSKTGDLVAMQKAGCGQGQRRQ